MSGLIFIGVFTLYVTLLVARPRTGAALAFALFAWYGWQEIARGSVAGVFYAAWCVALYAGIPLMAATSLSPARTGKA